jgi:2-polyprenyl-3-methyl-5-hydroxy-6-metoxy-1,4-benzoquinol methylase
MFQANIMSDSGVKSFFETQAHNYKMHPSFYSTVANKIKQDVSDSADLKLLDVGCGDGTFIKSLISAGVKAEFLATDISFTMSNMARINLRLNKTEIVVADAFNIPLIGDMRFDVIHVAFLLHHLIGKTRAMSTALARKLISTLFDMISENGMLIIEEVYYNSYLLPRLTSSIIFHILKLLSFIHFGSIHISKNYKPGLQVNFFNESELEGMLRDYGSVHLLYRNPWKVPELYRIFLLADFGNIVYTLRKR